MESERMGQALSERSYFINLFLFYLMAHGSVLLIPNAIYWDDWVVYRTTSQSILELHQMLGSMFNLRGHLHVSMLAVGPWLYRVLTFVLMFASGILLWQLLKRHLCISVDKRYAIVLLFLVLPFYDARAALVIFPYTLCYFLFFLAWYLLDKNRLFALTLFFLSFNTNSLLVFYALPIAEWYLRGRTGFQLKTAWRWTLLRFDFIVLPIVFWFIKITYFKPYGIYEGYNENFSLKNLILSIMFIADDFIQINVSVLLMLALLILAYLFIKKPSFHDSNHTVKFDMFAVGAFVCGVFPYSVVGAMPTFELWGSSNQLLMPLGIALMLTLLITLLPFAIRDVVFALLISVSLTLNIQVYSALYQDWSKKKELLSLIAKNDEIRSANLIVFDDRTELGRYIRYPFYEWNGLMKLAYGDETRFGLNPSQVSLYLRGGYEHYFDLHMAWNAKDHLRNRNQKWVVVRIEDTGRPSTYGKLMRLIRGEPQYSLKVSDR